MLATTRIFDGLTLFMLAIACGYGYLTGTSRTGVEWVGTTGLALSAGLCLIIGAYMRFVDRRIDTLPEDYENAEVSDGAGELGFFSPHSIWPLLMVLSLVPVGFGAAFWNWWAIITGAVFLVITVCGLVFEYHWPREKH